MLVWIQRPGDGAQLKPRLCAVTSATQSKRQQSLLLVFGGWVIGPLIYCSRLQTWSSSWPELRRQQNCWERSSSLSARNPRLTEPVWGEWRCPPPTDLRSPLRDAHWQFGILSCHSVEPVWFWVPLISCLCPIEMRHASPLFLDRFYSQCTQ